METSERYCTLRRPETRSQSTIHWHADVWWYLHTPHCSGHGRAARVSGDISQGRVFQHFLNSFQHLTSRTLRGDLASLSWKLDRGFFCFVFLKKEIKGWRGTTKSSKSFTYFRGRPLGQQWACPEVFGWLAEALSHCVLLILWKTTETPGQLWYMIEQFLLPFIEKNSTNMSKHKLL